jgi:8-oxo-dGTP diphosphatase
MLPPMPIPAHCPHCGNPVDLVAPSVGRCGGCEREVYANSRPAAGVFLVRGAQVLLVRRGAEPRVGAWDIPGGFLLEGERPEDGAAREIKEELSYELDPNLLRLALVSVNPWPGGAVLDVLYEAEAPAGEPVIGDDAAEARWFPIDALPEDIAFESSRTALIRWRQARGTGHSRGPKYRQSS